MCLNPSCAGLSNCPSCEQLATQQEREAEQQAAHDDRMRAIVVKLLQADLRMHSASLGAIDEMSRFRPMREERKYHADQCQAIRWGISFLTDTTICSGGA